MRGTNEPVCAAIARRIGVVGVRWVKCSVVDLLPVDSAHVELGRGPINGLAGYPSPCRLIFGLD